GFTTDEGMRFCRAQFGDEMAIAVIEPPYRETQLDLVVGGRWFWADSFAEDTGALVDGIEKIWAYLLRHFPVDQRRVCIAGEGAGGTVAVATTLYTDRMSVAGVAIRPVMQNKLKELPLPLPEYRLATARSDRTIVVWGDADLEEDWSDELAAYKKVEVPGRFAAQPSEPLARRIALCELVADALELEIAAEAPAGDNVAHLVVAEDAPRAQFWARLQALKLSSELDRPVASVASSDLAEDAVLSTEIRPAALQRPKVVPKCPGPFGGTTVVVLPDDVPESELDQWLAAERNDPLAAASRFHRLRIAKTAGDRSVTTVLEKLEAENRRNILIVPASFYASPLRMHRIRQDLREFEDRMTLNWLPGLGGQPQLLIESR
ncbi:MAG: hypothetical protein AAF961_07965, partial [Planctomycetota bacterium]